YNNNTHKEITEKESKADRTIILEHGKPMIFGKKRDKGLILDGLNLKVAAIGESGITEKDILVHDAHCEDPTIHLKLADMEYPQFPVALGVIRDAPAPVYDDCAYKQIQEIKADSKIKSFNDLVLSGDVWAVD
ncbi:MAG: 2-oxoacid:ferredoxin oxidoreductase subunit beta, partial [Bacteroidota bacterium]